MGDSRGHAGIRELREHASRYLAQVERGATIEITRHGRPVARLVPAEAPTDDRGGALVDERVLLPEDEPGDVLDVIPAPPAASGRSPSEELSRMRDEERW